MYLQIMYMHGSMSSPRQPRKTLRTDASTLVASCSGWNSRFAARRIALVLDRALAPTGLTAAQLGLLAQIAIAADDTIGALARRTGLDQSTLSRTLRTLEADNLVEIAIVETDLRRRAVWLTETGARRLEAALPLWRKAQARLARQVPADLARRLAVAAEALAAP
jgi:DNA-binding MarR family transcriptional regulator